MVDKMVRLGERAGAAHPGCKVLTLIHAIAAGADSIDEANPTADAGPRRRSATVNGSTSERTA